MLTPGAEGMKGAIGKAEELSKENGWFMPQQFNNEANPEIHRLTTGPEIADALDRVDAFVSGIGTGGTITGAGSVLKERFPEVRLLLLNRQTHLYYQVESRVRIKFKGLVQGSFRKFLILIFTMKSFK